MDYLSYEQMQKLKSVGFTYPEYEHLLNLGMVYYYHGREYFIGGYDCSGYTETDRIIAQEGCWLPSGEQLLRWLAQIEFSVNILWDTDRQCFNINAIDSHTKSCYCANGKVLTYTLANLVYKICKANLRPYSPNVLVKLRIE